MKRKKSSFSAILVILLVAGMSAVAVLAIAGPPSTLTALTNTHKLGPVLTKGAHTRVFTAPTSAWYGGRAIFTYNRTEASAFIDTLYIPAGDSLSVGVDTTCTVNIARESGQWVVPSGTATYTTKWPTISWLANPTKNGAKINWMVISFPAGDTLTAKLIIDKPNRR